MGLWSRLALAIGTVNGALAVAVGAMAAHALEASAADAARVDWVETAARYQLAHALALIGLAWVMTIWPGWLPRAAGLAFTLGIVLFSGGLSVAGLLDWRGAIPVVPVGGVGYIVGWLLLFATVLRRPG